MYDTFCLLPLLSFALFFLRLLSGIPLGSLSFRLLFCAALVSQLYYYTLFDPFCQGFFDTFFEFVRFAYLMSDSVSFDCLVCTMGLYFFSRLGAGFLYMWGFVDFMRQT